LNLSCDILVFKVWAFKFNLCRYIKDAAFEVDQDSDTYKMLHPNAPKVDKRAQREILEEHFDIDDDDEEEEEKAPAPELSEDDDDDDDVAEEAEEEAADTGPKDFGVKMYTIKDERHAAAFRSGRRATVGAYHVLTLVHFLPASSQLF
jgi:ribosome biogenesis protein ENP2